MHTLEHILNALDTAGLVVEHTLKPELCAHKVTSLSYDSRAITAGGVFIVKGANFREEYLHAAAQAGAIAYIADREHQGAQIPVIVVKDIRSATLLAGQVFYDHATDKLASIGVTGTKGKSTTLAFLRAIYDAHAQKTGAPRPGFRSTITTFDGVHEVSSPLTTPEPLELYAHYQRAVDAGVQTMLLEVSSQALKYRRTEGIHFAVGVFLNIGLDHISDAEHNDYEDYFSAKLQLFAQSEVAVLNLDSDDHERVLAAARTAANRVVTFGEHPDADVRISQVQPAPNGTDFHVATPWFAGKFRLTMPGVFNVSNAAAAIAVAGLQGIPEQTIREALHDARAAGRMMAFSSADEKITVIVDYAHNRLSFDALFATIAQTYPDATVVAVFGSGGCKALSRRKDLAESANGHADYVVLTEEDPGKEAVSAICAEIATHLTIPHCVEEDRPTAIRHAVFADLRAAVPAQKTAAHRVVLVLGKGDEAGMRRGIDWVPTPSDVDVASEVIAEYNRQSSTL